MFRTHLSGLAVISEDLRRYTIDVAKSIRTVDEVEAFLRDTSGMDAAVMAVRKACKQLEQNKTDLMGVADRTEVIANTYRLGETRVVNAAEDGTVRARTMFEWILLPAYPEQDVDTIKKMIIL